jgi:uncharacterized membrane protein YobD (UPF0266 family)
MNKVDELKQVQRQTAYEEISAIFRSVYNLPKLQLITVVLLVAIAIEGAFSIYQTASKNTYKERGQLKNDFWKASYFSEKNDIHAMNQTLNQLAKNPLFKLEKYQARLLAKAENSNNQTIFDALVARQILVENPEAIKALDRMVEAQKNDPKSWNNFLETQQIHKNNNVLFK